MISDSMPLSVIREAQGEVELAIGILTSRDNITFPLVINRNKEYNASLDVFDSSSVQLRMYDQEKNSQVYDSGVVTNKYL